MISLKAVGTRLERRLGAEIDGDRTLFAPERPERCIVALDLAVLLVGDRRIMRGHAEVGRALEHDELARLLGHDRDDLRAGRSGADDADPLAGEVDRLVGPARGHIELALETLQPFDVRILGLGQTADGAYEIAGRDFVAAIGFHRPALAVVIEPRGDHARLETNVLLQVEAIGDVLGVSEDFRLGREALGPAPFLLQIMIEGIAVLDAFRIAAGAGIAIPVPGSADVVPRLVDDDGKPLLAQAVEHVHSGKTSANDNGVHSLHFWNPLAYGSRASRAESPARFAS
jgi:hypothetical protein